MLLLRILEFTQPDWFAKFSVISPEWQHLLCCGWGIFLDPHRAGFVLWWYQYYTNKSKWLVKRPLTLRQGRQSCQEQVSQQDNSTWLITMQGGWWKLFTSWNWPWLESNFSWISERWTRWYAYQSLWDFSMLNTSWLHLLAPKQHWRISELGRTFWNIEASV